MEQLPDNLKWWLESYARQIEALGTSLESAQKAKARGAGDWDAIEPMIKTQWNQIEPYNLMCPDGDYVDYDEPGYNANNRCVTGCVATAMAQVLYYWQCQDGCDEIGQIEIGQDVNQGTIEKPDFKFVVDHTFHALPATTFDWESMALTYSIDAIGASADAVAKLMRYCGQAVNMDYNIGASSAHLSGDVLTEVFGYSKNIRELYRDPYTTSQWEEMIYAELAARRPVLYSGQSKDGGGHEFIIDGYDGNGLFHMNWGWGGMSDDYFVLSLANPNNQGAGGSQTNSAYQFDQSALFGVEPGNAEEVQMPQFLSDISSMTTAVYTRANADVDFTNVQFDGAVYIHYKASTADVNVQFGWALCQNGQIKQVVPSTFKILNAGKTYSGSGSYTNTNTEAALGAGLPLGKYEVCQVYKLNEDAAWSLCSYYWNPSPYTQDRTAFLVADVTETTLTVRQTVPSFKVNSITAAEYPSTGSPLDVTLNVTNDGETNEQVVRLWTQKEGEATWTYVAEATRRIDPGMTDDINMSYVPTAAGTYTLKVTNANSNEALKTAKVTVYASFNAIVGNLKFVCNTGSHQAILSGHTYTSGYNNVQLEIPATFVVDGTPYAVTEIADGAFYNCNILSEVTVPEGVKRIGKSAFPYCYNLSRVSLPSTLQSIGDNAFYGCPLMSVVAAMQNPVNIARNVFMAKKNVGGEYVEMFTSAELYVPIGKKAAYSAADIWKEFLPNINEIEMGSTSLPGDVDGNGSVGPEDIEAIVKYIMGGWYEGFNFENANLNGDDKVDASDLVLLISMPKSE